jgi:hypothetical protein
MTSQHQRRHLCQFPHPNPPPPLAWSRSIQHGPKHQHGVCLRGCWCWRHTRVAPAALLRLHAAANRLQGTLTSCKAAAADQPVPASQGNGWARTRRCCTHQPAEAPYCCARRGSQQLTSASRRCALPLDIRPAPQPHAIHALILHSRYNSTQGTAPVGTTPPPTCSSPCRTRCCCCAAGGSSNMHHSLNAASGCCPWRASNSTGVQVAPAAAWKLFRWGPTIAAPSCCRCCCCCCPSRLGRKPSRPRRPPLAACSSAAGYCQLLELSAANRGSSTSPPVAACCCCCRAARPQPS